MKRSSRLRRPGSRRPETMRPARLGDRGQETTLAQLDAALREPRQPRPHATARAKSWARKDAEDLAPELGRRSDAAKVAAETALAARGREEAASLRALLQAQRDRIGLPIANSMRRSCCCSRTMNASSSVSIGRIAPGACTNWIWRSKGSLVAWRKVTGLSRADLIRSAWFTSGR